MAAMAGPDLAFVPGAADPRCCADARAGAEGGDERQLRATGGDIIALPDRPLAERPPPERASPDRPPRARSCELLDTDHVIGLQHLPRAGTTLDVPAGNLQSLQRTGSNLSSLYEDRWGVHGQLERQPSEHLILGSWRHVPANVGHRRSNHERRGERDVEEQLDPAKRLGGGGGSSSSISGSDSSTDRSSSAGNLTPPCCLGFKGWLREHMGSRSKFLSIVAFVIVDAGRREAEEENHPDVDVNPVSISVVVNFLTVAVGLMLCWAIDGKAAVGKVLNYHCFWRWALIAGLMLSQFYLQAVGVQMGLDAAWVDMLSYANVPIALLLSSAIFKRVYGKLEVLAVAMLTLGMGAFIVLRVRCMETGCMEMFSSMGSKKSGGVAIVLLSTFVGILAWTLSERIVKGFSPGVLASRGSHRVEVIRVMIVHLAFCQMLFQGIIWVAHSQTHSGSILGGTSERPAWFGNWKLRSHLLVLAYVLHMFLSCHIIKRFSTVTWVLTQVVASLLQTSISDPMLHRYDFDKRAIQSIMIAPTIVLSALIFQTGRLNVERIQRRLGIRPPKTEPCSLPDRLHGSLPLNLRRVIRCLSSDESTLQGSSSPSSSGTDLELSVPQGKEFTTTIQAKARKMSDMAEPMALAKSRMLDVARLAAKYASVILYILSQACRENFSQKAQSSQVIVPQSLNVATALAGLVVAASSTWWRHGWEGVRQACNPYKVAKFLLPAAFFAVSAFFGSMAFAMGASAAAKDAAGRIYTPAAALLSRWILGKFYMWLEWLALVILTLSCTVFGLLDTSGSHAASLMGLTCAMLSGLTSAINSLVMERLMRDETDSYIVQSVRLNIGSLMFNGLLLFVMGWIGDAEHPARPDLAFWNYRPMSWECSQAGSCAADGAFLFAGPEPSNAAELACACGRGVFVGWGASWVVYAALASGVVYSWVTGLVVKQFSSIYRSVADGIMLLVLYFFMTPLLDQQPFPIQDMAKLCVVLMVPLSGTTFSYAAWEMQQAIEAAEGAGACGGSATGEDISCACGADGGEGGEFGADARATSSSAGAGASGGASADSRGLDSRAVAPAAARAAGSTGAGAAMGGA